jgi:hypothetical protein
VATSARQAEPPTAVPQAPLPPPTPVVLFGNFDGAGADESVGVSGASRDTWSVDFNLHAGRVSAPLPSFFQGCYAFPNTDEQLPYEFPHVVGVAEFRGDGVDEALVEIYHGASTGFAAIFGIVDGTIRAATAIDGANACQRIFPFNGSVTHGDGFACANVDGAARFNVLQALSRWPDYHTWDWYRADYQWRQMDLHLASVEHQVFTLSDQQLNGGAGAVWPAALLAAWQTNCRGLPANLA